MYSVRWRCFIIYYNYMCRRQIGIPSDDVTIKTENNSTLQPPCEWLFRCIYYIIKYVYVCIYVCFSHIYNTMSFRTWLRKNAPKDNDFVCAPVPIRMTYSTFSYFLLNNVQINTYSSTPSTIAVLRNVAHQFTFTKSRSSNSHSIYIIIYYLIMVYI